MTVKILVGDALSTLRKLAPESVHCVITSPPYFGLRDYGTAVWEGGDEGCDHKLPPRPHAPRHDDGSLNLWRPATEELNTTTTCPKCGATRIDKQMGLESTPELFIANMVEVFREVRRVLRSDGVCWVNMGDSYASQGHQNSKDIKGKHLTGGGLKSWGEDRQNTMRTAGLSNLKPKDLMGMPWRLALALQQPHLKCSGCDHVAHKSAWGMFPNGRLICPGCELSKGWEVEEKGWWLRSDIIWAKPNPMPESVTDRPTKAHEYVFLLTKSARYFYDNEAVREGANPATQRDKPVNATESIGNTGGNKRTDFEKNRHKVTSRNRRTVWTIEQDEGLPDTPDTVELTEEQTQAIYDILASGQRIPPDAPEPSHEYVFLLTKSARYFYDGDAVKERGSGRKPGNKSYKYHNLQGHETKHGILAQSQIPQINRNKRTVWTIATQPFSAAHFATFPPKLVEPMIKAGTSERGCCSECGAPWERVTTKTTHGREGWGPAKKDHTGELFGSQSMIRDGKGAAGFVNVTTTGWQPTCTCHGHFETIESDSDFLKPLRVYIPDDYYFCPCTPITAHIDDLDHGCPACGETMIPAPHSPTIPCTVLDPFAGACTTGLVADRLGRDAIMIELNPEYAAMGKQRIANDAGWVTDVEVEETAVTQMGLFEEDG